MQALKEFDYNLWTTKENGIKKYWIGIKATGETTEVDAEVMRLLRNEEKKMRREIEKQSEIGTILSLEYDSVDERSEQWLIDTYQLGEEVVTDVLENDLEKLLTPFQREIYDCCMKNGMNYAEFAKQHNLDSSTVYEARDAIRKKYKKIS